MDKGNFTFNHETDFRHNDSSLIYMYLIIQPMNIKELSWVITFTDADKMPFEMMLSLGPNLGVTSNKDGSFVWNDGYVLVKQKTLLNDMFWADLNQAMPVD